VDARCARQVSLCGGAAHRLGTRDACGRCACAVEQRTDRVRAMHVAGVRVLVEQRINLGYALPMPLLGCAPGGGGYEGQAVLVMQGPQGIVVNVVRRIG